jgi:hypothetical protein
MESSQNNLGLRRATANKPIKCSLCSTVVLPGELFWRACDAHEKAVLWICTEHIPLNTSGMITDEPTEEEPFHVVRPVFVDVRRNVIPPIIADWNYIYRITDETFEELVFDRLLAMGLQGFRTGRANKKDGGIDIVFWTDGPFRTVGAVQVKQHRSSDIRTGPDVVRQFDAVVRAHEFSFGLIVTNTEFTRDARWHVENHAPLIQLRDGSHLKQWILDDFRSESWNAVTDRVELCPGVEVDIPRFQ